MTTRRPDGGWKFTAPVAHPGEILNEEFLIPYRLSKTALAHGLHVTPTRITEIVNGDRGITADTALRLSLFFGTTPEFWTNLQTTYDLSVEEAKHMKAIEKEVHLYAAAV